MIASALILLQDVNLEEKMKNAHDKGYEIGVFIGSMLPYLIFVVLAYIIYRYTRKRLNDDQ